MADTPARRVYIKADIGDITPGKKVYREGDRVGDYKEYTIKSTIPSNLVTMPFDRLRGEAVGNFKTFKIVSGDDKQYRALFNEAKEEIIIMIMDTMIMIMSLTMIIMIIDTMIMIFMIMIMIMIKIIVMMIDMIGE